MMTRSLIGRKRPSRSERVLRDPLRLALVVADTGATSRGAGASVAAALAQVRVGDALIWIEDGSSAPPPAPPAVASVVRSAQRGASRGELYGEGLAAACGLVEIDAVAFTDTETLLGDGWRRGLDDALQQGQVIVGGPVLPGASGGNGRRDRRSWAGFLVEYAPHAVPPYRSASGDLSANNVAYRLELIRRWAGTAFWKTAVDRALIAEGHSITMVPDMVAVSARAYGVRDLTVRRWAAGRLYACDVASTWSWGRRIARAALTAALPAVLAVRLRRLARMDPVLGRALRYAAPCVAVALLAWSGGEAHGYLRPARPPRGVR